MTAPADDASGAGPFRRVLIANRGEVAVRVEAACADLGVEAVAVYPTDDEASSHVRGADNSVRLPGFGASAYLDREHILAAAIAGECDALHPGWGFLSEDSELARLCAAAGITFIGPAPETLEVFGDKAKARAVAQQCDVPVLAGTAPGITLDAAEDFMRSLGPGIAVLVKAVAGGGGRGMRVVREIGDLAQAIRRCQAEAQAAFGRDEVYLEQYLPVARHIEVQIVGDGHDLAVLGERECTLQRAHQKLIEVAPAPGLSDRSRSELLVAARALGEATNYSGLGTVEFVIDAREPEGGAYFLEVNPRLQVEHTVTECVTGLDLVTLQIRLAAGARLAEVGLEPGKAVACAGMALQSRVNAETMTVDGSAVPASGSLAAFELPHGPGVRVDTYGYAGYQVSPAYDTLIAKVIVWQPGHDWKALLRRASRALAQFRIEGVRTNLATLRALVAHPDVQANAISTTFVESHAAELTGKPGGDPVLAESGGHGDALAVVAPTAGTVVGVPAADGTVVEAGAPLVVLEAMKMEHIVIAPSAGVIRSVLVGAGDVTRAGQAVVLLDPVEGEQAAASPDDLDLDRIRPDLAALQERDYLMGDQGRQAAVKRRHGLGMRTIRENIETLVDSGSFVEYGKFVLAPQRARRSHDELLRVGPADGIVTGLASINGSVFGGEASRAAVLGYDWTVFGGTQGALGHKKTDRILELAEQWRLPIVLFAEGGGGRPGDTEFMSPAGLNSRSFTKFGRLSGLVPLVGVTNRFCFAGNAAFLACCDVIIATEGSNIGMGGPAMIEGGGLGVVEPTQIGPASVQAANGVIDILVPDENSAIEAARRYLAYFQGSVDDWRAGDQRILRHLVPENRKRIYDVRAVIRTVADTDSGLELRPGFGAGIVTALARMEGRPVGIMASNPAHLGGAVDAAAADKAARFMQLCDAFGLPIVTLLDTPGFMVGPEAERSAQVRHFGRLFVTGANLSVPVLAIALRKGYGLGALASVGGGFQSAGFVASWPTGEFGGMGIEGHVRLAFPAELEAIPDEQERRRAFEERVAILSARSSALSIAEDFEIDAVIDPAHTRAWIRAGLASFPRPESRAAKRRPYIDPW